MRTVAALAAGVLIGAAVVAMWRGGEPSSVESSEVAAPRAELARARRTIERLRAQLAERAREKARGRAGRPVTAAAPPKASLDSPHVDEQSVEEFETRAAVIRQALEAFESDPVYRELYARHARDEAALPGWDPERMLEDPAINPRGVRLGDAGRREFELLYALACQRVEAIDLSRRLVLAEAVATRLEERLDGVEAPPGDPADEVRVVTLPAGLRFELPLTEFPEIALLEEERKVVVYEWLAEARAFLDSF